MITCCMSCESRSMGCHARYEKYQDRHVSCHGKCSKYQEFRAACDDRLSQQHRESEAEVALFEWRAGKARRAR